jgi:hypothetical protein
MKALREEVREILEEAAKVAEQSIKVAGVKKCQKELLVLLS